MTERYLFLQLQYSNYVRGYSMFWGILGYSGETHLEQIDFFLKKVNVIAFDEDVAKVASDIRKKLLKFWQ